MGNHIRRENVIKQTLLMLGVGVVAAFIGGDAGAFWARLASRASWCGGFLMGLGKGYYYGGFPTARARGIGLVPRAGYGW